MTRKLDEAWTQWLQENINRKCNPEELLWILLKNGFDVESIRQHMGGSFPTSSSLLKGTNTLPKPNYNALAHCRITRANSGLNAQKVPTDKIQLYTLDGFLSPDECDRLVEIARKNLYPSKGDRNYRTSSSCDLSLLNDPNIEEIDEKIARILGIQKSYSEGIQAQHYDVGQEFKGHFDYFVPGSGAYKDFVDGRGQRTWTFMVYLNEGMTGGGTKFHAIDMIFAPKKGTALTWNNLDEEGYPNHNTMHSGLPVESGHKIIITKWFREMGTGPMFYDDAYTLSYLDDKVPS